jgi:hypothetical protein
VEHFQPATRRDPHRSSLACMRGDFRVAQSPLHRYFRQHTSAVRAVLQWIFIR